MAIFRSDCLSSKICIWDQIQAYDIMYLLYSSIYIHLLSIALHIKKKLKPLQNSKTFFSFCPSALPKLQEQWWWEVPRRQHKRITPFASLLSYNCCLFICRKCSLLFCFFCLFCLDLCPVYRTEASPWIWSALCLQEKQQQLHISKFSLNPTGCCILPWS